MRIKYVAKAIPGIGWRIFNRKTKNHWGNFFKDYPQDVLEELNGKKRPEVLVQLCKKSYGEVV